MPSGKGIPRTVVRDFGEVSIMRTVIVGGRSSLGIALAPVMRAYGEVITAGRSGCDIKLDLNDSIEQMALPAGVDAVIHTAAHFGGSTIKDMLEAEEVNVLGTLKLCQAAVQSRVGYFVLISSMSAWLGEDSPYYGIYSVSKKHAEDVARLYCSAHNLPLAVLRPSQIYGNGDSFRRHQPFLYAMADRAETGDDIVIHGSRDALRNYIHVEDVANVIARVVQHRVQGVYSCLHTLDVKYSEIAMAVLKAFNGRGAIRSLNEKADIPDNIFPQDHSLYKLIDYYPRIPIEHGIKMLAHFRGVRE